MDRMNYMTPLEKSIALNLIKNGKKDLDIANVEKFTLPEDLNNDKESLLNDILALKELINPGFPEESWMLYELEEIEKQLTDMDNLKENLNNILNEDPGKILEILEKRYLAAYEDHDVSRMDEILYAIRIIKKHIDCEIGKNIIDGRYNEKVILLNNGINKLFNKH